MNTAKARGILCIWTDIDPQYELDFNRWYDREHMQERVAIEGFQYARRFVATSACPQPYLALYYTDNLGVFTSEAYRQAFSQQTPWSLENFTRMRGTQRRVGCLSIEAGAGEGGVLALFVVPAEKLKQSATLAAIEARLIESTTQDHVVSACLLQTDTALSTPVTANAEPAPADALVMIEASHEDAALQQARSLAEHLGLCADEVFSFKTLWRLAS
jgi:hypothetical protein